MNDSSEDEPEVLKCVKKRRVIASEDEDDCENNDNNSIKPKCAATKRAIADDEPKVKTPSAKVAKKTPAKEKEISPDDVDMEDGSGKDALLAVDNMNKVWAHETLDFLRLDKIRDKNKNRPGHPEYDPRTLHVPPEFKLKQTPGRLTSSYNSRFLMSFPF